MNYRLVKKQAFQHIFPVSFVTEGSPFLTYAKFYVRTKWMIPIRAVSEFQDQTQFHDVKINFFYTNFYQPKKQIQNG